MDYSPEELRSAIREMFADGLSRKAIADKLRADYSVSTATAYRRISEAMPEQEVGDTYKVADLAIGAIARLLMQAEDANDKEATERLAVSLATVAAKLKAANIVL